MTFYAADFFFLKIGTLCFAVFESFPLIPPRKASPYPDKQFSPTFVYLFPIYISMKQHVITSRFMLTSDIISPENHLSIDLIQS